MNHHSTPTRRQGSQIGILLEVFKCVISLTRWLLKDESKHVLSPNIVTSELHSSWSQFNYDSN